jgi:hypothetical protein
VRSFNDLPSHLQTEELDRNAAFLDEETVEIDVDKILGHIDYILSDLDVSDQEELCKHSRENRVIGGILYRHPMTGQFTVRDPRLRRILPSEIYKPTLGPPTLETLKIFLDLYYDDFGAYRNVYHSVGGVYLVIENLPLELRQKLRNIFLLGFVPSGVAFDDFFRPFVDELRELQGGIKMNINSRDYWVVAGVIVVNTHLFSNSVLMTFSCQ